jgi:hypothetical protein
MTKLIKRLTGSQGAGIGVGGTSFILLLLSIYHLIKHTKKTLTLKKTRSASATSLSATLSPTETPTAAAPATNTPPADPKIRRRPGP